MNTIVKRLSKFLAITVPALTLVSCSPPEAELKISDEFLESHELNVNLNDSADGLKIAFNNQSDRGASYHLLRSSSKNCDISDTSVCTDVAELANSDIGSSGNFTDTLPSNTYYYQLRVTMPGDVNSTLGAQYPDIDPPSNVVASAGDGQVSLSWDAVSGAESYNIYVANQDGVNTNSHDSRIADVISPFLIDDLSNGVTYYFVITAENSNNESGISDQVQAKPVATAGGASAPVFTSASTATATENSTSAFYTATATDADGDSISYSIAGGTDANFFIINPTSGALSLINPLDYENPGDDNGDNLYSLNLVASDGFNSSSDFALFVFITDLSELEVDYNLTADQVTINYSLGADAPTSASATLYRADEPIGTATCSVLDGIDSCANGSSWVDVLVSSTDSIDWSARRYYQLDINVDGIITDRFFADIAVSDYLTMTEPPVSEDRHEFNLSWQALPNVDSYSLYISTDANAVSATDANWSSLESNQIIDDINETFYLLDPDSNTTLYLALSATSSDDVDTGIAPLYQLNDVTYVSDGSAWQRATASADWSGRSHHASVIFNNNIWVLGGYDGGREDDVWHSADGEDWTLAAATPGWSGRGEHTSVVFDDKIWTIGGYDGSREDDVWYSVNGESWTRATSAADWSGREEHTSVAFDGKLWVIGGYDTGGREDDVWYSVDGTNWTLATATADWSGRGEHTSVVFDGKLWVLGGYDGGYEDDVWFSEDGTNWTLATATAGWSGRYGHTSVVFDNKLWVIGGYDGSDELNDVWYSEDGVNWTQATSSAGWTARYNHTSVVFDDKLWALGGYDINNDRLNDVWYSSNTAINSFAFLPLDYDYQPPQNQAPTFTSGTAVEVDESTIAAYTAAGIDPDGGALAFAISGGADAELFVINSSSGELSFIAAPDYENPADSDGDNVYKMDLAIDDGSANGAKLSVAITIINEIELPTTPIGIQAVANDGEVTLKWQVVNDASSYRVYWDTDNNPSVDQYLDKKDASNNSATVLGLSNATIYYFVVTALNDLGESSESAVVGIKPQSGSTNQAPTAVAGADQNVKASASVSLDGSSSSDSDGSIVSYSWRQTDGTDVDLTNADQAIASFTAPEANATLEFELTVVDDDDASISDRMLVEVAINVAPIADAGVDQSVTSGVTVSLDGSGSSDSDGSIASYSWTQIDGDITVDLLDNDSAIANFTAPTVDNIIVLEFQLSVSDDSGATSTDNVTVTISSVALGVELWTYSTGDAIDYSSPAIGADGTIYIGSWDNYLHAINPENGSRKWRYQTIADIQSIPSIGANGDVYFADLDGYLYALDPENGSLQWSYQVSGMIHASPAVGDSGTIYVGTNDNYLHAISPPSEDRSTAALLWNYQTDGTIFFSSPAISADGALYVGSRDGYLYAIAPPDDDSQLGRLLWSYQTTGEIDSSPAIGADGTVYIGSDDDHLYAISPPNDDSQAGVLKWSFQSNGDILSSPAIGADGTIYIGSTDSRLYALSPDDGSLQWSYQTEGGIYSSPAVGSDDTIYVGSVDNYLHAVSPPSDGSRSGALLWRFQTGASISSSPAIATDGAVYVGSYDNKVYAISSSSTGLADSPWPKFGRDNQNTANASNPPSVSAGASQSKSEGSVVNLVGSATDDGSITSYLWEQTSGTAVIIFAEDNASASFIAPQVDSDTELVFQLTATDDFGASASATATVTIRNDPNNQPPVAEAGEDQTVNEGTTVKLSGSNSSDTEGVIQSYSWQQLSGAEVTIVTPDAAQASFVAPKTSADSNLSLVFALIVTDSAGAQAVATVTITVQNSLAPLVFAGSDQNKSEGSVVNLIGSATDDGSITSYLWEQVSGANVIIFSEDNASANFIAPQVDSDTDLVFRLTATNDLGYSANATTTATIQNDPNNQPPVAEAGDDQIVNENTTVQLSGLSSRDAEGNIQSYSWQQLSGAEVTIVTPDAAQASFVAPKTSADSNLSLVFALIVTDSAGAQAVATVTITVQNSLAPLVFAGSDQNKNEGSVVNLIGSATDDGSITSYLWEQVSGANVIIFSEDNASANFIAPQVDSDTDLVFRLTATNDLGYSANATTTATIQNDPNNQPPVAEAGDDQIVNENTTVQLSGLSSRDAEGNIQSYSWQQLRGAEVAIITSDSAQASFSAPETNADSNLTLVFALIVSDSTGAQAVDTITITVENNEAPLVSAGSDQTAVAGVNVILYGSASDGDGTIDSLQWQETSDLGIDLMFNTDDVAVVSFTVPNFAVGTQFIFELTATDDDGASASATTTVTVISENEKTAQWTYTSIGSNAFDSSPALASDGSIYIGSFDGSIYSLNPDGSLDWNYSTGGAIYSSPAIAEDGTIYIGSDDNSLYAISPNGNFEWSFATTNYVRSSPAIAVDGRIYFGSYDNSIYALEADGSEIWSYSTGGDIYSSPLVGTDGVIYVGSLDGYLYALTATGALKWRYQTGGAIYSSPVQAPDGSIYVGSDDNYLYALARDDGSRLWRYSTSGDIYSSPAIGADGTIYVGSENSNFYALTSSGDFIWSYDTGGAIYSSPAIDSSGNIYFGSADHYLYSLSPQGNLNWRYSTGGDIYSSPTIASNGSIYFGSRDNKLYALRSAASGLQADSPWPKFRYNALNQGSSHNEQPVANAGANQEVQEGSPVDLIGTATDSDGTIVAYSWSQLSGTSVSIASANSANASFIAPSVDADTNLLFQLQVTDSSGGTGIDTITITVLNNPDNQSPTVDAGANQSQTEGFEVSLLGSASDEDGSIAVYSWDQISGTEVVIMDSTRAQASFIAPAVDAETNLSIQLQVTDNEGDSAIDLVIITVLDNPNDQPPVVDAGADQSQLEGTEVNLSGSASDDDGTIVAYSWSQLSGREVVLIDSNGAQASFITPAVDADTSLSFQLLVTDDDGASAVDVVTISVLDNPDNQLPVVDAGGEQKLPTGVIASLHGSASDSDGAIMSYLWSETSASIANSGGAEINRADTATANFNVPADLPIGTTLTFELTATDYLGASSSDSATITIAQEGSLKWRYQTGGDIYSSPAIGADGTVYVGSLDSYLYAIAPPSYDSQSGELKWRYQTGNYIYSSPAIGADGTIYVGSDDNYLYAIAPPSDNSQSGVLKWRYQTGNVVRSSPAIGSDGIIYVGSNDNYLYAIAPPSDNSQSGVLKWRYQTGSYIYSSPAIDADGTVYVGSHDNYLYAIASPSDGSRSGVLKWRYETGDDITYSSPAISSDGTIYVGSWDKYLYAIAPPINDSQSGVLQWRYQTGGRILSSPTIDSDGIIYVGSYDNYLYAIAPPSDGSQSGVRQWRYQTGDSVDSSPVIGSDGILYIGNDDYYIRAIAPPNDGSQSGVLQWRYQTGGDISPSSPAVGSDGTVYFGSYDNYLYAITSSSSGITDSAWPKFGYDNQNVGRANIAPSAIAGSDQSVAAGATVSLSGASSSDSDGAIIDYYWQEISGFGISILNNNSAQASFTAPDDLSSDAILTIQLTVTDNSGATATDTLEVSVPANP